MFGIFVAIKRQELLVYVCALLFITLIFLILLVNYYKAVGLYIIGDNIYYKKIRKQYINPKEIKGIKIICSYSAGGKYRGFYPIKDNRGNSLYTAIFVKDITQEMIHFDKGDLWFIQKFKQHILAWTVYSEDAVNYLKTLEPDIEVLNI